MRMRNSDFGMRNIAQANGRGPRRLAAPAGISLIEILISMGVLAIGLLGVAALIPVGGHYLRQGDVSDRADAIAQASLSEAIARGMLDPENWLAARWGANNDPQISVYDRPFADFQRRAVTPLATSLSSQDDAIRAEAIRTLNLFMGSVFVIDPMGVAESMDPSSTGFPGLLAGPIGYVPASTNPAMTFNNNINANSAGWYPWSGTSNLNYPDPNPANRVVRLQNNWPVRRLTVATGAIEIVGRPVAPMRDQAERMVVADDDLSIELNDYEGNPFSNTADSPSQQRLRRGTAGPLFRESKGDFSWMLTVVPTTTEARDALARDPESHNYDVSSVVFYKRDAGGVYDLGGDDFNGHGSSMLAERQVRASVGTTGIGGGQLRLFNDTGGEMTASADAESPLEKLKAGQWVMLFGPHPDSSSLRPLIFCQWYRVVALESDDGADASVFLRGPDWPWQPLADVNAQLDPSNGIQNDLRLVIMPDVVAVHTRTMKLQSGSAWGID